ncbi:hypothetical protein [Phaeodactylibacter xiamenensis]|jgi:hypothetical protein|uniref:hypothetical protein n=1 Tax=Phaeodactylibacter xiamenensis TaxID=1524460 RepID=UPI0024A7B7A5|nr:hypothetical protein [Phaeodactylibacter xiamenensis]
MLQKGKPIKPLVEEAFPAGFENIHEVVGCTRNKATRVLDGDGRFFLTAEEVRSWAKVLSVEPYELLFEYGCGYERLNSNEINQFVNAAGKSLQIDLVEHAA